MLTPVSSFAIAGLRPVSKWPFHGHCSRSAGPPCWGRPHRASLSSSVRLQRSRSAQKEKEEQKQDKKTNPVIDDRAESGFCTGRPRKKHSSIQDTTFEPQNTPGHCSPGAPFHLPKTQGRQVRLVIKQHLRLSIYPTLTRQGGLKIGRLGLKEWYFRWGQGRLINKCTGLLQ